MCGLVGYFGASNIAEHNLKRASRAICHRGPDGEGFFTASLGNQAAQVLLAHRRLAIIDLDERSNQPMRYEGGLLAFNGEIYNYKELRDDLRTLGHHFYTTGDTEVLAHAIQQWGVEAFDRLEGMWSIAWFDSKSETLLLSRDRFGEKPLFLWPQSDGVYFGSEIKAIFQLAGQQARVDYSQIRRFLVYGYRSIYRKASSFFEEIEQVDPGSVWIIKSGRVQEKVRYWSRPYHVDEERSYLETVDRVREAFIRSVELRTRSDVPIAYLMSGGIDSNSIIGAARKSLGHDVHGFTISNSDLRYSEAPEVQIAKEFFGIRHTEISVNNGDFYSDLQAMVNSHDAPILTTTSFVQWKLFEKISELGYKVALSGNGSDEIFSGYYDHHLLYLNSLRNSESEFLEAKRSWERMVLPFVRNPLLRNPNLFIDDPGFREHLHFGSEVFKNSLLSTWDETFDEEDYGFDLMRNRMMNELSAETIPVLLNQEDFNAMSHSIENRAPFLDSTLVSLGISIPSKFLVQRGKTKAVLRDAVRGLVPDQILDTPKKVGFNAPIGDLVDLGNKKVRNTLLSDSPILNVIKRSALENLVASQSLTNSQSKFLFSILSTRVFLEKFS